MHIPFSYLPDASVLRPNFLEVALMLSALNAAPSNNTAVVFSVIPESNPPITPAIATGFWPSVITSISLSKEMRSAASLFISLSKVLSTSSKVVNFSPSTAFLTTILPVVSSFKSNACNGWPCSNITKFVISTILFIGLTPASISLLCIQYGDGPIFTSLIILAEYLGQSSGLSTFTSKSISSSHAFTSISG